MDKREGEVSRFSFDNFFYLTVPKKHVREPFSLSVIPGIDKVWMRRRGKSQGFPSKISFLTVTKNLVGEPFGAVF